MAKKRIGELLLEQKAITRDHLEAGLATQKFTRQRLGLALIDLGFISEQQLASVLSQALGVPLVDLGALTPDWAAIHMLRSRFCENHELFPFALEATGTGKKSLVVAMSDPLNGPALQEIEFTTGLVVSTRVATHSQVRQAIWRYYHKGTTDKPPTGPRPGSVRVLPPLPPEDEPDIVVGQELPPVLAAVPKRSTVGQDLDFLFGDRPDDETAKLEKKFWALMRIMARKGLVTADEFARELEEDER